MNLLCHFYLDRFHPNPYYQWGICLPEWLKPFNAKYRKSIFQASLTPETPAFYIREGIKRHYEVDANWHHYEPFISLQQQFKNDILEDPQLQVYHHRAFIHAHLWVELLQEWVLIKQNPSLPVELQTMLLKLEHSAIEEFWSACGWNKNAGSIQQPWQCARPTKPQSLQDMIQIETSLMKPYMKEPIDAASLLAMNSLILKWLSQRIDALSTLLSSFAATCKPSTNR